MGSSRRHKGLRTLFWLVAILALCIAAAGCLAPVNEYRLTGYKDAIQAAEQVKKPILWQIELGPVLVEEMRLFPPDHLLVVTRLDDLNLTGMEWLFVDTSTGTTVWRYRPKGGRSSNLTLIVSHAGRLICSEEYEGKLSLVALEMGSGRESWTVALKSADACFLPSITFKSAKTP